MVRPPQRVLIGSFVWGLIRRVRALRLVDLEPSVPRGGLNGSLGRRRCQKDCSTAHEQVCAGKVREAQLSERAAVQAAAGLPRLAARQRVLAAALRVLNTLADAQRLPEQLRTFPPLLLNNALASLAALGLRSLADAAARVADNEDLREEEGDEGAGESIGLASEVAGGAAMGLLMHASLLRRASTSLRPPDWPSDPAQSVLNACAASKHVIDAAAAARSGAGMVNGFALIGTIAELAYPRERVGAAPNLQEAPSSTASGLHLSVAVQSSARLALVTMCHHCDQVVRVAAWRCLQV
jgi:hypothetical protein